MLTNICVWINLIIDCLSDEAREAAIVGCVTDELYYHRMRRAGDAAIVKDLEQIAAELEKRLNLTWSG